MAVKFKKCKCGAYYREHERVPIRALGGNPIMLRTAWCCAHCLGDCFRTWAEENSELCVLCNVPFFPGDPVQGHGPGNAHLSCGMTAAAYLGTWQEDGTIKSPFKEREGVCNA